MNQLVKHISDCLPNTRDEIVALIREQNDRDHNFSSCESPIEEDFLRCFYKVKADDVSITGQESCNTRLGRFRFDFVITKGLTRIAVECDGKEFHDKERDKIRDEAILESGFVDSIYRVPGRSLWFFTNDVLDLLRGVEPTLFSERGNQLLDIILRDDSKRQDNWEENFVARALSRRKLDDDDGEGVVRYESPNYVLLEWRRSSHRR